MSLRESKRVRWLFVFMLSADTPERIIGDKAYDSDALDKDPDVEGIELIARHRKNRTPENVMQDGRPLHRYERRWNMERTNSWIQLVDPELPPTVHTLRKIRRSLPRIPPPRLRLHPPEQVLG